MATRILVSDANLSTSAGSWRRAEAAQLTFDNQQDDLFTPRTLAVTFANAGNQQGLWVYLRRASTTSLNGTLTIKLQEQTSPGVWEDRTTDTFNLQLASWPQPTLWAYFALTSYAVTTAANTWRYSLQFSVIYQIEWKYSIANGYCYAAALDVDTGKPGAGDTILIASGVTLTFDESASFAYIYISSYATFQWENPPSSSRTLTLTSHEAIKLSGSSTFRIGTEAFPIPAAQRAIIDISSVAGASIFSGLAWHYETNTADVVSVWGAETPYLRAKIAADAAAGQANIVTVEDMSAIWSIGDTVTLYGKQVNNTDTVTYTINNIVGTTITLSANLDFKLLAGGAVVNLTEADNLGVQFSGHLTGYGYFSQDEDYYDYIEFVGCFFYYFGLYVRYARLNGTTQTSLIRSCLLSCGTTGCRMIDIFTVLSGITISNCHRFIGGNTGATPIIGVRSGINITTTNLTVKNSSSEGYGMVHVGGTSPYATGVVISDIIAGNCWSSSGWQRAMMVVGYSVTVTNCFLYGVRETLMVQVTQGTFTNVKANGAHDTSSYNLYLKNSLALMFSNCEFGATVAAGTYDVYVEPSHYIQALFKNCKIGTKGLAGYGSLIAGSYLKWHTYNQTANDHRSWVKYGLMRSVGDGLADTTVHTAGAGKFALRFEPQSSANDLEWQFNAPTGNIQGKTMTVAVWCAIKAHAYYAGMHQMPRLTVTYDNGTTAYAELPQGVAIDDDPAHPEKAFRLLSVVFTPTTTFGQTTVTLSGRTDAVGADAYIYWDDGLVLYPAGYVLDMGGMDNWANALPVESWIATVFSAQDVWEAQVATLTGMGTIGKLIVDMLDAAISSRAPSATALSTAQWTNARAALLDYLDAAVSSRLASVGYTAPDNASITAILEDTGTDIPATLAGLATAVALAAVQTVVDAVQAKTDNLPAQPAAVGSEMTLTAAERTALNTLLGASNLTLAQAVGVMLGALAGKTSGMETGTPRFRDILDTKDVIAATLDDNKNRTATTVTP